MTRPHITPDEARRMAYLRGACGMSWRAIAREMDRSEYGCRRAVKALLDRRGRLYRRISEAGR